jgi:hypothetical protein
MLHKSLREEKFTPENLSAIEEKRWLYILKRKELLETLWKPIFTTIPEEKMFQGMRKRWDGKKYVTEQVCFDATDDIGIHYDTVFEKSDEGGIKFVRCIPENKLGLYINSSVERVQKAVRHRLAKVEGFGYVPVRQDLVDAYFLYNQKSQRINDAIGYCNTVIEDHFYYINKKIDSKHKNFEQPMMALSINGRVYIYKDKKFILKPESRNWIFFETDRLNEDKVDSGYLDSMQLTVIEKEDCYATAR